MKKPRGRRVGTGFATGVTLLEVLVVTGLIGLLIALLLPAAQTCREQARALGCKHNLRQLGLAIQSYHAQHGLFPAAITRTASVLYVGHERRLDRKRYSVFSQILSFADNQEIFNSINFDVEIDDPFLFPSAARQAHGHQANATVMNISLGMFICPSDGESIRAGVASGTNYRANLGAERYYIQDSRTAGPFAAGLQCSAASVRDGMSYTAAFGEKLRGRESGSGFNPRIDLVLGDLDGSGPVERVYAYCSDRLDLNLGFRSEVGLTWIVGSLAQTCYNHVHGPNSTVPDCIFWASPPPGLVGSRSNHPGGVQLSMADGSVRFISSTIDRSVWKALGTRSGGEAISDE